MALSYSLGMPKLGNVSASSLVKSAATLSNELNTYQDTIQKINFENDPTDQNFNSYVSYLQSRIDTLQSAGTITDMTKAANLTQSINSAYKTNTSFNIDAISTQMLNGNATDQTKLDYLTNNVLQNSIVQGDPSMYAKYMQQAYGLQQSIQYQAQAQQIASEVTAQADLSAQERGFTSAEAALKANWTQLQNASKNGDNADVQKAFKDSMAIMAPIYKASGISIPKNAVGDMGTAKVGYLLGLASFYEHAAVAAGPNNPDAQGYMVKAQNTLQGTAFHQALTDAMAPSNLHSDSTNAEGQVSQVQNLITGYQRMQVSVPGLNPVTLNIPQTNGSAETSVQTLGKGNQSNLDDKLKSLGFNILPSQDGYIRVNVSDQAAKWLGNNKNLVGQDITIVPTSRGVQFQDSSGNLYGLSFDTRGLAGLYKAGLDNQWLHVGGQYGFNPNSTSSINNTHMANPIVKAFNSVVSPVANFINGSQPARRPSMSQRAGGGFNFTNANGQAISAATYAMQTGQSFRGLLQSMANRGDGGAQQVLGYVGNDYHYDPTKIGAGNNAQMYNAMTWGAEPEARVNGPSTSGGQLTLPSGFRF